jgi:hypothetical protein
MRCQPTLSELTCSVFAASILLVAGCRESTDPTHNELSELVARQASRQEVISTLGSGYTWYGRNGDTEISRFRTCSSS